MKKPADHRAKPVPEKATSCMMTTLPKQHGPYFTPGVGWVTPGFQPSALVLYFDGFGLRRVYLSQRTGHHVVKLNRRFHRVDITTMALTGKDKK